MSDPMATAQTPTSATGTTAAQPTTDAAGTFSVELDAGRYYVIAPGMNGLAAPAPAFFTVSAGSTASVTLTYSAGSR